MGNDTIGDPPPAKPHRGVVTVPVNEKTGDLTKIMDDLPFLPEGWAWTGCVTGYEWTGDGTHSFYWSAWPIRTFPDGD